MSSAEVLVDAFDRIRAVVHETVSGLDPDQLAYRVDPEANSIAWLVWHLTRVQDDHVSDVAAAEQAWTAQDWLGRFGLPFAHEDIGYGHDPDEVADVRVDSGELLTGYHDAVHARTVEFVAGLTDDDLAEVVDAGWTPPVTLGVRLVSVIADDLQHAGQAAFIRGILERVG
ncbi:mycothiol transferase [Saccharopolyspora shandongensis]|uniref:DinB superfamily protein n=1 Tax=Saccharopolyspora shandongensis TaxID=418495 RepID=A0A1H3TSC1_9PSEU|nr:DUF664 domain-containing protein [Saccharopolyspora shandongensis]SDZ52219.1 Protein of unknown function [Saccharopolyspora shandongensis]